MSETITTASGLTLILPAGLDLAPRHKVILAQRCEALLEEIIQSRATQGEPLSEIIARLPQRDMLLRNAIFDALGYSREEQRRPFDLFWQLFPDAGQLGRTVVCPVCRNTEEPLESIYTILCCLQADGWKNPEIADWLRGHGL